MSDKKNKSRAINPLSMNLAMTGALLHGQEHANLAMVKMVQGMQKYQASVFDAKPAPKTSVWRNGQSSLFEIENATSNDENPIVVLIPSLVNGAEIFDLYEDRSMCSWFSKKGFRTYLFDWDDLTKDDVSSSSALITDKLQQALEHLKSENPNTPIHVLGYCMGGTLCVGLVHHAPDLVSSLTLLASPWNYHVGTQALLSRIQFWAPSALMQSEKKGALSASSLQMLFASVDPLLTQRKFEKFLDMSDEEQNFKLFVAVEDWLNNGFDIPENVAQECITQWYLKNVQHQKKWNVGRRNVDPCAIECPIYIVASKKDRLVDYESSMALAAQLKNAEAHDPDCGHIGMIAGANSIHNVWQPIADWMRLKS